MRSSIPSARKHLSSHQKDSREVLAGIYDVLSSCEYQINNRFGAMELQMKAMQHLTALPSPPAEPLAKMHKSIGIQFMENEQWKEANTHFNQAIHLFIQTTDTELFIHIAECLGRLGIIEKRKTEDFQFEGYIMEFSNQISGDKIWNKYISLIRNYSLIIFQSGYQKKKLNKQVSKMTLMPLFIKYYEVAAILEANGAYEEAIKKTYRIIELLDLFRKEHTASRTKALFKLANLKRLADQEEAEKQHLKRDAKN